MRMIAHRIFKDETTVDNFDPAIMSGFDGAEFDLRCGPEGDTVVFHGPVLRRGRTAAQSAKRLEDMCRLLAAAPDCPRFLLLDIKTLGAAENAAAFVAERAATVFGDNGVETAFLTWREEELRAIRARLPEARIYFVLAPIALRGRGRFLPKNFYVFNRYPYLASASRFRPRLQQANRHNINLRVLAAGADALAPGGADGVCFHRMFLTRGVIAKAKAQGLGVAVFGWRSREQALRRPELAEALDLAIVKTPSPGKLRRRRRQESRTTPPA